MFSYVDEMTKSLVRYEEKFDEFKDVKKMEKFQQGSINLLTSV